jgi:hypothetical protein
LKQSEINAPPETSRNGGLAPAIEILFPPTTTAIVAVGVPGAARAPQRRRNRDAATTSLE